MRVIGTARLLRGLLAVVAVVQLAGCVTPPAKQAYNREANATIKRIRVLPLPESQVGLDIVNNPAMSFGLIGLAIAEANLAPKRNWLEALVRDSHFDHVAIFRDRFDKDMMAKGYELIWSAPINEDTKKPASRETWGYRKTFMPDTGADAQLDIKLAYVGYAAAGGGSGAPYHPTVGMSVKLVSADGKVNLLSDLIIYNPVFPQLPNPITINPNPEYTYPEFNALQTAGPKALDGLRDALEASADELAKQFGP